MEETEEGRKGEKEKKEKKRGGKREKYKPRGERGIAATRVRLSWEKSAGERGEKLREWRAKGRESRRGEEGGKIERDFLREWGKVQKNCNKNYIWYSIGQPDLFSFEKSDLQKKLDPTADGRSLPLLF